MPPTQQKIHTVDGRSRLSPRKAPYWQKLQTGGAVGFRRTENGLGTWLGQWYDPATRKQHRFSIGDLGEIQASHRYDHAVREVRGRLEHLCRGGSVAIITVADACAEYVQHLKHQRRAATANDHSGRFQRHVLATRLARIPLTKLKRQQLEQWRSDLMQSPVSVNKSGKTRARSSSSVNRDMTALRAALNYAHGCDHVTSDVAWRTALRPIKGADKPRDLYLSPEERSSLYSAAERDIKPFISGLSALPLRPGTIAKIKVGDLDIPRRTLRLHDDKGHSRTIMIGTKTLELLVKNCAKKTIDEPIFSQANGSPWHKDAWKIPIKRAVHAAGLNPQVSAYTFRHSNITDLIIGGYDPLTVAKLAGTSLLMIQKHYGHLINEQAAHALDSLL